jgi:hypothetical protein
VINCNDLLQQTRLVQYKNKEVFKNELLNIARSANRQVHLKDILLLYTPKQPDFLFVLRGPRWCGMVIPCCMFMEMVMHKVYLQFVLRMQVLIHLTKNGIPGYQDFLIKFFLAHAFMSKLCSNFLWILILCNLLLC